jgi:hypothetical protein
MIELTLTGTASDIGRGHGEFFYARIKQMAESLREMPVGDSVSARISATANHLSELFPEIIQEIEGISEGAGITFEEAFLLSNRSLLDALPTDGCSHVAVIRSGSVAVGMNKDSRDQTPDDFFVARIRPSAGRATLGYRHVGRAWGYGINDAGLCAAGTSAYPVIGDLGVNTLASAPRRCPVRHTGTENALRFRWSSTVPALGLYFAGPVILSRCRTAAEAVDLMMHLGPVSESGNVLVADESDAAVVEFSPDKRVMRRPEDGIIASTNFYASREVDNASDTAYLRETQARYEGIRHLAASAGSESVKGMQRILSHHAEAGSVCRHDPTGDRTVFSFVALPRERRLLVTPGPPCEHVYKPYILT